jgi:hypothetical protein
MYRKQESAVVPFDASNVEPRIRNAIEAAVRLNTALAAFEDVQFPIIVTVAGAPTLTTGVLLTPAVKDPVTVITAAALIKMAFPPLPTPLEPKRLPPETVKVPAPVTEIALDPPVRPPKRLPVMLTVPVDEMVNPALLPDPVPGMTPETLPVIFMVPVPETSRADVDDVFPA